MANGRTMTYSERERDEFTFAKMKGKK